MLITDLETAERVVARYPWLSFDGWTIVHKSQDDYAEYLVNGTFDKSTGKWYKTDRYAPSKQGWNLPDRIVPKWAG